MKVIQIDTQDEFAMKFIKYESFIDENKFIDICLKIKRIKCPCFMELSYFSLSDKEQNIPPALYTPYAHKKSLLYIIDQLMSGNIFPNYDFSQKLLILYGIINFLKSFQNEDNVHGRLKLSNVLLDDNYVPYISDPFLYQLTYNIPNISLEDKTIEYIISLSPEAINNQLLTPASDIYSFGIIALQILTHQINVFSEFTNEIDKLETLISNGSKPMIPPELPGNLSNIIDLCISKDPKQRPSPSDIITVLESILLEDIYIKRFTEFKELISPKTEKINPKIAEIKKKSR